MNAAAKSALLACFALITVSATSQTWGPGKYMGQAVDKIIASANRISELGSFGFSHDISLMGAAVYKGQSVTMNRYFYSDRSYIILAGGDEDATDIDLSISSVSGGTSYVSDNSNDNYPVVVFTPDVSGNYAINVKLYSCLTDLSFVCCAIMDDQGFNVPMANLYQVSSEIIAKGQYVNNNAMPVQFLGLSNQWCLYGGVYASGDTKTISNINLGTKTGVVISCGDDSLVDCDLELNNSYGLTVGSDKDASNVSVVPFEATGGTYDLKMTDYASNGYTLMMTVILTD